MDLSFSFDTSGRLRCALIDGKCIAAVTAANGAEASTHFLQAVHAIRGGGAAECFWHEQGGTYRWMFVRRGDVIDVAVMWCAGVVTGWQHVFRADFDPRAIEDAAAWLKELIATTMIGLSAVDPRSF